MKILKDLCVTNSSEGGISARFRGARFDVFLRLIKDWKRPIRILDVGGTELFWERRNSLEGGDFRITTVNLEATPSRSPYLTSIEGDATNLAKFDASEFDLVFSNSVIEHLFNEESQMAMGHEITRFGLPYWVQTPNYWFPVEPHFHLLGWQWYPRSVRIGLLRRIRCGMRGPVKDRGEAAALVDEVRLMSERDLRAAMPGARIYREKFGPLTKSLVAISGFENLDSVVKTV